MKRPIEQTVALRPLVNRYMEVTAAANGTDIKEAIKILSDIRERCEMAISVWKFIEHEEQLEKMK